MTLAAGPWTEARFRVSPPQVVRARHWMTYAESLRETATLDISGASDRLDDEARALKAKTPSQREAIAQRQIKRARRAIAEGRIARREARAALLLDEED